MNNQEILKIYCDESGFTGENLLNEQQTIFTYASVVANEYDTVQFIEGLKIKYNMRSEEIKTKNLLKPRNYKGKKIILEIFKEFKGKFKVCIFDKKFALASKFFEYLFEPIIAKKNSYFYGIGLHKFISNHIYSLMTNKEVKDFMILIEKSIRTRDTEKIQELLINIIKKENDVIFTCLINLVLKNFEEVVFELNTGKSPILDLTVSALHHQLSHWNHGNDCVLQVFCDNSKILEKEKTYFNNYIGRKVKLQNLFGGDVPISYNLFEPINLVDSKDYKNIQVADVISSTFAYVMKNNNEFSRKIRERYQESITVVVVADYSFIDYTSASYKTCVVSLFQLSEMKKINLGYSKDKLPLNNQNIQVAI